MRKRYLKAIRGYLYSSQ